MIHKGDTTLIKCSYHCTFFITVHINTDKNATTATAIRQSRQRVQNYSKASLV